ncbi:helix-turn-helix domain-containing protein [Singulisphaera acidiphila]|uniref:Resolvase family protein n=1 Tax=Singulisphaera acidiphila (strain ATCC BAA-1392 / DSM 18658 / VKM B-2454 / MOB10) TaxID=886293 RepID=L0DHX5_SINAD|nr:helix-turn-helix domain-containing protein [Singulisphaera acidiphila]AGA28408.1 resolvase family protein [Singulisphaera acidiphila DSM 18658]
MISDFLATIPDPPRRRGRPKRVRSARVLACAEAIRAGEPAEQVAKRLGIHRSTVYRWLHAAHQSPN